MGEIATDDDAAILLVTNAGEFYRLYRNDQRYKPTQG